MKMENKKGKKEKQEKGYQSKKNWKTITARESKWPFEPFLAFKKIFNAIFLLIAHCLGKRRN